MLAAFAPGRIDLGLHSFSISAPLVSLTNCSASHGGSSGRGVVVIDITDLCTWQGWMYLAVVMDLYVRKIVGWSMKPALAQERVLDVVLMAAGDGRARKHHGC